MEKIGQLNEQTERIDELKERNLELYEKNMLLEEQSAGLRQVVRANEGNGTDEEHIKEMLGTQTLLREEMQAKEQFKEQVQELLAKLTKLKDEMAALESKTAKESQRRLQEVQLLEEKSQEMHDKITSRDATIEERDSEIAKLKQSAKERDAEIDEMRTDLLNTKSQVIEKDSQIGDLMETLAKKGEETAQLSTQYLELKNFIIDQEMFQTKYSVTRVPISEIMVSPNLQIAIDKTSTPTGTRRRQPVISRKDLVLSFVHDKQRPGEFFV